MSAKNLDKHNRWRNKTVAFRVSPEEDAQIETAVKLTGLTKQDYIIRRLLCRDVVVQGNPRVYKALRDQLALQKTVTFLGRMENPYPVMKAAEQAGFPEYSTFLRAFQNTFHTSPKNFR